VGREGLLRSVVLAGARVEEGVILGTVLCARALAGWRGLGDRAGERGHNDVNVARGSVCQTGVYLTAFTTVEDDVFIARRDHDQRRHDGAPQPEDPLRGATLRRVVPCGRWHRADPGVEIAKRRSLAAGRWLRVTPPRERVVMGVPPAFCARCLTEDLLERWPEAQVSRTILRPGPQSLLATTCNKSERDGSGRSMLTSGFIARSTRVAGGLAYHSIIPTSLS